MRIYQSEVINELSMALAKAQAEMGHADKGANNPYFKSKYADLPAIIDAAKPSLSKHGLSVVQLPDIDEKGEVIMITQLNHSSGQWMRGYYPVNPIKKDPQGLGSAITYARRYSYGCITGVAATNEDDDGNAASNLTPTNTDYSKPKSQFGNASARKIFQENITKNFHNAHTLEELNDLMALDKPKFALMESSGAEADQLSLEEIRKQFVIVRNRLSNALVPEGIQQMDEHLRSMR